MAGKEEGERIAAELGRTVAAVQTEAKGSRCAPNLQPKYPDGVWRISGKRSLTSRE
jgi:hypothetical protein